MSNVVLLFLIVPTACAFFFTEFGMETIFVLSTLFDYCTNLDTNECIKFTVIFYNDKAFYRVSNVLSMPIVLEWPVTIGHDSTVTYKSVVV